jgi:uncharacterized protein YqgC (DUF456 family)
MTHVVLVLAIIVMLVGLAGSFLPIIPGLPIIFFSFLGYGLYTGWVEYGFSTMLVVGIIVAISVVLDQLASMMGAKKFGAGKAGMIGSIVGAILGGIFFSLPGLIAGTFLGAAIFELVFARRDVAESLKAGLGALIGFLASSLFKFLLGLILIAIFIYKVIVH